MRYEHLVFPELRLRIVRVEREGKSLIWTLRDIDSNGEYKFRSGSKTGPNLQLLLHLKEGESIEDPEKYVGTIVAASKAQFDIRIRLGDNHQRLEYVKSKEPLVDHFVSEVKVF